MSSEERTMSSRRIDINCPLQRIEQNACNQRRLEGCRRFASTDRAPVVFGIAPRYVFAARGKATGDYFENPRSQLEQQLLNHKWLIEHAIDDRIIDTAAVSVKPDLSTLKGGYFDVGIQQFADGTLSAVPILHQPEDIERLEVPDFNGGPYGRAVDWFHEMREVAADYEVTLNGKPLEIRVTIAAFGGPFPDAYALAGQNLFLWMVEAPQRVCRLMEIVTSAFINFQRYVRDLSGDAHENLDMGCDAAEMVSAEMFREFVVPYYLRCYEAFPGRRGFHNCGRIDHLIRIITEELEITHLNGFGFPTSPELLARWMGGKVVMSGGLHPVILQRGPREAIRRQSCRYLEVFAPYGGYILQDGFSIAPGTPLENLAAVVEAAEEFREC